MQLLDNCDLIIVAFSFSTFRIVFCSNPVTSPLVTNSLIFFGFFVCSTQWQKKGKVLINTKLSKLKNFVFVHSVGNLLRQLSLLTIKVDVTALIFVRQH